MCFLLQKLNEILVKIVVLDEDDNKPQFIESNMTKGVRVNAAIYTELATVKAVDIDANADTITYHLESVTFYRPRTGKRKVGTKQLSNNSNYT